MRVAPPLYLSPEERSRLLRQRSGSGSLAERAELILLAADGLQDSEIARRCGVHRQTVARWRRRFRAARLPGLVDAPSTVRRGRIAEDRLRRIVRTTVAGRAPGARGWSTRSVARQFGVSHMTVQRLWEAYRIRPRRLDTFPARPDPVAAGVPWDVVGLYLEGSAAAVALTLRPPLAPSEVGVLGPSGVAPSKLRPPSEPPAPVPWATPALARFGPGPPDSAAGSTAAGPLLRFLGALAGRMRRHRPARVIATRPDLENAERIDLWRVRHPEFQIVWADGVDDWKRRTLAELASIGRRPTSAGQFRGRAELGIALSRSVSSYRFGTDPFHWMARAADVAEGDAAYGLRYDLAVTGHSGFKSDGSVDTAMPTPTAPSEPERRSARKILREYLGLRAGERVTIESWTESLGYANAFVLESLRLGGRPLLLYQDEPTYWAATTEVPSGRLAQLGDHRRAALERTDVFVSFFGPSDRERFHSLPSSTMFRLSEYQDSMYDAAAKARARSVQMAVGRVSAPSAKMYGVERTAWRDELVEATLIDPKRMRRRAASVARRLQRGTEVRITHPNGTRLTLRLRSRSPAVSDGQVAKARRKGNWTLVTLPAGVVSVALDESHAEGTFRSNVTSSCGLSDSVGKFADGRWTFERGRLVRFTYGEGQELFSQSYGRAGRGRERPASLSIGLNPRIANAPLLEDQGLGTITLNIGRNDSLGGTTRTPWWAWLLLRGGDLTIDGTSVVRAGSLVG